MVAQSIEPRLAPKVIKSAVMCLQAFGQTASVMKEDKRKTKLQLINELEKLYPELSLKTLKFVTIEE